MVTIFGYYYRRKGISMILKLSKDEAAKLRAVATLAGVSVSDFVVHLLKDAVSRMGIPAVDSSRDREVILDYIDPNHVIATLKAIRTATDCGLKDAKDIMDRVRYDHMPMTVKVPAGKYMEFVSSLKRAGASFRQL